MASIKDIICVYEVNIMSETVRSITRVQGFKDSEMDFQLLRQLGSATYGGASIGESLALAAKMSDESAEQWVINFAELARRQEQDAIIRLSKNHLVSAREQFLKACNSYRAAEYFTHSHEPQHREFGLKSRDCFLRYLELSNFYYEVQFIEYNGLKLPYYFIATDRLQQQRKTIIIVSGFDGTLEESFIQSGLAALARGYNVVCFAGPGQMDSLRFNPQSYFEPDFEKPITSLLDVLQPNQLIDFAQVGLLGISFGGYFAARAACYDERIKALVANSPISDLKKYVLGFSDSDENEVNAEDDFCYADIPHIPDSVMPPSLKELTANLLLRFGNRSMQQTLEYLKEFNIQDQLQQINCPVLALIGAGEGGEPLKQFEEFVEKVSGTVLSYQFSIDDGADTHCQVTNLNFSNCVIYDWLDEVFEV